MYFLHGTNSYDLQDMAYLDSFLQEENSDEHPKKFPCNPCKSAYNIGSIERGQKKQHDSSPNAHPVNSNQTQTQRAFMFIIPKVSQDWA
jgi:hypothetical protein